MSVNKDLPHVFVLPEDDANRQLANGFHRQVDWNRLRQMQVLKPAGGWMRVMEEFQSTHVVELQKYPHRIMVLLIDLDEEQERVARAKADIPEKLKDRVFILGVWSQPEALRRARLGSYEAIGSKMAEDCRNGTLAIWGHELLRHNAEEIDRLREGVRPILFRPD